MPHQNQSSIIDDKNYHAKMKRMDNAVCKLGRQLGSLCQQEKSKGIQEQKKQKKRIKELKNEIVVNEMNMIHLKEKYDREVYRRKHCPIPSAKCPIAPMRPASHA